jgi:thermostable 8-oxoguanine DNA glycosylase
MKNKKNSTRIKKIEDKRELHEEDFKFDFNPDLTNELDNIKGDFDENIINKIALWKLNRFPRLTDELIRRLNKIGYDEGHKEEHKKLLIDLLGCSGVQLPMASTFLRFKNPKLFQIIDQHAYRLLTGDELSLPLSNSQSNKEKICQFYFRYLEDLEKKCKELEIPFEKADRILYQADKRINKDVKLKNY